jgi:EAL domain-containing protein (putative c-di-GMP-specific phosphodiesterase class I)
MINLKPKLANMQLEIDKVQTGYCMLVKIINYDELYAMLGSVQTIVDDLNKIVRKICNNYSSPVFSQIDYNKILIVLSKVDNKSLSKLSLEIYKASQLYLNKDLPSAYMNCQIATIDFPKSSKDAIEMYTLLIGILSDGKSCSYYHEYDKNLHDLNSIKNANYKLNLLRQACALKTRVFAYQPIIDRKTATIPYYECLLRIPDEQGNLVSVGPIIHEAENKGLINLIDFEVFQMAIEELIKSPETSLSVNISNYGVLDDNLLEMAEELLKKHKVAKRLIVEITETLLNKDYERTKLFIHRLHKFGCRFALDDFGSGFTSFKQLQNLPIDIIKIDGSYVRNIVSNHHSKYFIETLVKISEELGIKTVAEFVENGEIAKFLIDIKVDGMQGNFFSPASCQR